MCCFHGMGVRGVVEFSVKGGISLGWWYWEGRGWGRGVRRIGPGVDVSVAPGADFGFGFFEGGGWGFGFAGRHCNLERIRAVYGVNSVILLEIGEMVISTFIGLIGLGPASRVLAARSS